MSWNRIVLFLFLACALLMGGACSEREQLAEKPAPKVRSAKQIAKEKAAANRKKAKARRDRQRRRQQAARLAQKKVQPKPKPKPIHKPKKRPAPRRERTFVDLLEKAKEADAHWKPQVIAPAKLAAAGIRRLESKHLILYTDLPSSPEVDELPHVFDLAFPQWCDYFQIDAARHSDWKIVGRIICDKARFRKIGLLPDGLPPFLHGYQTGHDLWVYEQPSTYYRRHLLLHEGTHGFMSNFLGRCGPPWYMEGTAEWFGTHRWKDGKLTMRYFPKAFEEVERWGRINIVQREHAAGRDMSLSQVMDYGLRAHLKVEPYAWCWAMCMFLDSHPKSSQAFHEAYKHVRLTDRQFTRHFRKELAEQWPQLSEEWQLFTRNILYNYDLQRELVQRKPSKPVPTSGATVSVDVAHGWQSSGLRLEAGVTYQITATGRYSMANRPKVWWCEPGGVTIHYWAGRPLGQLLGAIRPDKLDETSLSPLADPTKTIALGLSETITPRTSGTLYLQINDSPAKRSDNTGKATVAIKRK